MRRDADRTASRRDVLGGIAASLGFGTAGCLGDGTGGSGDATTDDGETSGGDGGTAATRSGTPDRTGTNGTAVTTAAETLPSPALGPDDAGVTVAVYKDFACPHCATFTAEVEPTLVDEYVDPGVVRFEHHDFPIPVAEPASYRAPNAARAVQARAGDEAFFAYAGRLFANQPDLGLDTYADLADAAPGGAVRRAARERVYRRTVRADRAAGVDRGVRSTPAVFVDGTQLDRWNWEAVAAAIEHARDRDGDTPAGLRS